jgi:hypothetical protein
MKRSRQRHKTSPESARPARLRRTPSRAKRTHTAAELRKMPAVQRARILREQAKLAVPDYLPGGDLYIEGAEDIIEY